MTSRAWFLLVILVVLIVMAACGGQGADWTEGTGPDERGSVWKNSECELGFIDAFGKPRVVKIPNCPRVADADDDDAPPPVPPEDEDDDENGSSVAQCIKTKCKGLTGKTRAACNHTCQKKGKS